MNIFVEYIDISNINILRLKIKNELNKRNIDFSEYNLDINTHWLNICFVDKSLVYNKSKAYLILEDNEKIDVLFDKINKVFDYFFTFKDYYLVEKQFDWMNFNGEYEIKTLNFYDVDMLDGYKHIFDDKNKMIDYITMRINSCIDEKLDDIYKLREIKDKVIRW